MQSLDYELTDILAEPTSRSAVYGMNTEEAAACDAVLERRGCANVRVDRARLDESLEAWVLVSIDPGRDVARDLLIHGLDRGTEAVLVWGDSD